MHPRPKQRVATLQDGAEGHLRASSKVTDGAHVTSRKAENYEQLRD